MLTNTIPYIPLFACALLALAGCSTPKHQSSPLAEKIKCFAPTVLTVDTSKLSDGNRRALGKLIKAARFMDDIYIRQVWSGNEALRQKLQTDKTDEGIERLHYFSINLSPWSTLDNDEPFINGVPNPRPQGANYYPQDLSREEFSRWLSTLAENERKKATGFFYTIRRGNGSTLTPVPYSDEYRDLLIPAAALLREAATETDNATLRTYLTKRADAFLSNDYYESDLAWLDVDSPLDVTIGPYEVYMDRLFNYKAAFEAFVGVRDEEETAKLAKFAHHLQEIEDYLPVESRYRNPRIGGTTPIRVLNLVVTGGEASAGVQTAAFNLPNDDRITAEKGTKSVMLKNVQEAKFEQILLPVAGLSLDFDQQTLVTFNSFFTHILAHELMHGLGPHTITVNGRKTTVRQELKDLYSTLEEAKADIGGLFALQYLMDHSVVDTSMEQPMYVTFLAGVFRSVRFGIEDAHGKGMALQFNYLTDEGAFQFTERTGTFRVNFGKVKEAVRKLTGEIITIQAEGNYTKAKALLDRFAVVRPALQRTLNKLTLFPYDIDPQFPIAQ